MLKNSENEITAGQFSPGDKIRRKVMYVTEFKNEFPENKVLFFCIDNKFMITLGLFHFSYFLFKISVFISFKNYITMYFIHSFNK